MGGIYESAPHVRGGAPRPTRRSSSVSGGRSEAIGELGIGFNHTNVWFPWFFLDLDLPEEI